MMVPILSAVLIFFAAPDIMCTPDKKIDFKKNIQRFHMNVLPNPCPIIFTARKLIPCANNVSINSANCMVTLASQQKKKDFFKLSIENYFVTHIIDEKFSVKVVYRI